MNRRLEYLPLDAVVPAERNPKNHADEAIGASIDRFGFTEPILMDERTGRLVAGHGRIDQLRARHAAGLPVPDGVRARKGEWLVPVVRGWSSETDAEADAYLVASNRLVELGGWDGAGLADLLGDLAGTDLLELSGYTQSDLDALLAGLEPEPDEPGTDPDDVPPPPAVPVTQPGDLWLLGPHRLLCGDSRDPDAVALVMAGATINVAFTSPPYADRRVYDETSPFRPVPPDAYLDWFAPVAANVAAHLAEDGSWFVNIKPGADGLDTDLYVHDLVAAHVRHWGWHFATEFCWERNGVPKSPVLRFKNQFEPVYQFARGRWKFRPDNVRHPTDNAIISLGAGSGVTSWHDRQGTSAGAIPAERVRKPRSTGTFTRHQGQPGDIVEPQQRPRPRKTGTSEFMSSVQGQNHDCGEALVTGLAYPGNRLPTFVSTHEALGHTAAFPVGLPGRFIQAFTDEGDVVYEPFAGSGSTLIAAERAGRVCHAIEISPAYCDVILRRFLDHTGVVPTHATTGAVFE